MHSHRTPTKYSTPPPKPYKDLESPTTAGSYINPSSPQYNHHFSVLKMISMPNPILRLAAFNDPHPQGILARSEVSVRQQRLVHYGGPLHPQSQTHQ